jgi:ribosomal protein S18 acetylase RimI-like enzyme
MEDEPLQDLSPAAVARAIEANHFALWRDRARLPDLELHDEPERMWVISRFRLPATNCVLRANFEQVGRQIHDTLEIYRSRRLPMTWWIGPSTRPDTLGAYLTSQGLTSFGQEPGMAADLSAIELDAPSPPELTIVRVGDRRALRQCVKAFATGFGLSSSLYRTILAIEWGLGLDPQQPRQFYLGLWNGKPVATALLFLGAGVAGLYSVSTVPQARGRGIGTAMAQEALRQGRDRGYRVGILYASQMGLPIYRRMGFREYFTVQQYGG